MTEPITVTIEQSKRIISQFLEEETLTAVLIDKYRFEGLDNILIEYIIEQTLNRYPRLIEYLCEKQEVIDNYSKLNISKKNKDALTQYLVMKKLSKQEDES